MVAGVWVIALWHHPGSMKLACKRSMRRLVYALLLPPSRPPLACGTTLCCVVPIVADDSDANGSESLYDQ